ncbi:uncharacterized protein LOC142765018 [Rhipicephalus microplus]|uniref:uncharacterized protein LOC142765018 n=1 Tax=Rhipicephalus microplus TaxID=6941 RepID=UPI003F6B8239
MVGGLVLFSMMSDDRKSSNAVRLLSSSACAFGVSSATMLMANISSPACAFYLPRTLYYVLFHGLGAICYLVGAFCVSQYTQEVPLHSYVVFHGASAACYLVGAFCVALVGSGVPVCSVVGFCTGGLHAVHGAHAYYKEHARRSD